MRRVATIVTLVIALVVLMLPTVAMAEPNTGSKDNGKGKHLGVDDNPGNHYGWEEVDGDEEPPPDDGEEPPPDDGEEPPPDDGEEPPVEEEEPPVDEEEPPVTEGDTSVDVEGEAAEDVEAEEGVRTGTTGGGEEPLPFTGGGADAFALAAMASLAAAAVRRYARR